MANVRVWNDNVHPYKEKFREMEIHIPAKSFILMDEDSAKSFRGTYAGRMVDGDNQADPKGFKMIRLESASNALPKEPEKPKLACHACSYQPASETDLDEHITAAHLDQMMDKEEIEKRKKSKKVA